MSHRDNFIKTNKELKKPMDIFNVGFIGANGSIPDQVTGVAVTPDSTTELTVNWDALSAIPAVSGYLVERSPNGTDTWTTVAASNSTTSFGDSGLSVYTYYYYRVSAINPIGTGVPSAVANNRTLGTSPSTPTGLSGTANSTSQNTITWSSVSATPTVSSYTLEWSANGSSGWTSIHSSTGTSKTHTGLSTYTLYYYRVKATNAIGSSSYSSNVSVRTNGVTPSQVTGLALTNNKPDVGIVWNTASGTPSVTYTLQHSLSSTFASGITTKASGGTGTSYTDSSVTQGVDHYYRVNAVNAYASGAYSSIVTINIPAFSVSGGTALSAYNGKEQRQFTSSGSLVVSGSSSTFEVIITGAGGGGGGGYCGGGGGAGGLMRLVNFTLGAGTYTVTLGSGGGGGGNGASAGVNGTATTFNGATLNGGRGGNHGYPGYYLHPAGANGGGGGSYGTNYSTAGGSIGSGFGGGTLYGGNSAGGGGAGSGSSHHGGGGGGAGGSGSGGSGVSGGAGGSGHSQSFSAGSQHWAGGGGGGADSGTAGSSNGGGVGGIRNSPNGGSGGSKGGGGGGKGHNNGSGGTGGTGTVVVRHSA